jgi:hypothetical protein
VGFSGRHSRPAIPLTILVSLDPLLLLDREYAADVIHLNPSAGSLYMSDTEPDEVQVRTPDQRFLNVPNLKAGVQTKEWVG